jgi:hypothetical protein
VFDGSVSERIIVTKHAMQRARERLGLKRSAVQRTAQRVWEHGGLTRGSLALRDTSPDRINKLWGDHAFIFKREGIRWVLLTITPARGRGRVEDEEAELKRDRLARMGRRLSWRK